MLGITVYVLIHKQKSSLSKLLIISQGTPAEPLELTDPPKSCAKDRLKRSALSGFYWSVLSRGIETFHEDIGLCEAQFGNH